MNPARTFVTSVVVLWLATAAVGCTSPGFTEADPAHPQIVGLAFTESAYVASTKPILVVRVELAPSARLEPDEFILLDVVRNGGATLEARVFPKMCTGDGSGLTIACNQLSVGLHPGNVPEDIHDLLLSIDGKFRPWETPSRGGIRGTIHIFSGSVHEARKRADQHPAIRYADFTAIVFGAADSSQAEPGVVLGAFVFTDLELGPSHRAIPVTAGDTVTAIYENPDGSVLTASVGIS